MSDPLRFIRPTTVTDTGTFVRASTATYFDADGVMQTAGVNALRLTYDPANLAAGPRALVEPAATNRLTYSEQFDNVAWLKAFTAVTPNAAIAPDGTQTADFVSVDSSTAFHGCGQTTVGVIGTAYALSIFLKAGTLTRYRLAGRASGNWVIQPNSVFDLITGQVVASKGDKPAEITPVGNGWFRCSVFGTCTNGTASGLEGGPAVNASNNFDGAANPGGVYVWGAQLEVGTTATSYIPTTTAAVTRAADIITGSGLIQSSVPEADYPAWNAATSYTAGTKVIRTTTHKVYECLPAGAGVSAILPENATTGATPRWLDLGATNRWAMFDRKVGTITTAADSMTIVLAPGRINSLALLEIDAATVSVALTVAGESVYSASMNLTNGNLIGDWYQYFYEPVYQQDSLVITNLVDATLMDLPAYSEGILTITLTRTGGTVSCGVLVVGLYADLGLTQYSPTIGIIDYSRKDVDAFGNADILQRAYSKRMSVTALVKKEAVDQVARTLAQYRSTLLVWVGAGNLYTSMVMYGFYKDWEISIDTFAYSNLTLQVESVT